MTTLIRSPYFERVRRGSGRLRGEYAARCPRLLANDGGVDYDPLTQPRLPISLLGAYVALRISHDARIEAAFEEEAKQLTGMSEFLLQARSGMRHAVLPFSRRAADIAFAAAMSRSREDWALRGESTFVEGGYFRYSGRKGPLPNVRYVDRSGVETAPEEVLLDPSKMAQMLPRIEALGRPMARFVTSEPEQHWLRLELLPEATTLLAEKPASLRSRNRGAISLVSRASVTFLAEVELREEERAIVVPGLPIERVMELQAASLNDQWLLLEHPEVCALGPLPDLFTPASTSLARVEPTQVFLHHLGGQELETLAVSPALAIDLMREFHWVSAPHPVIWRSIAEASQ